MKTFTAHYFSNETARPIDGHSRLFTKPQLLALLEEVPQSYWPPRPTRQDKRELFEAIKRAYDDGVFQSEHWYNLASRAKRSGSGAE
jgi:hypothetical protein